MGRREFSFGEAEEIRRLLQRKVRADRSEQKVIRASIRRIGFYISDFQSSSEGFTAGDFDDLVEAGTIKISDVPGQRAVRSRKLGWEDIKFGRESQESADFGSIEGIKKRGFEGFFTIEYLQATNCKDIPVDCGVYLVLRPDKRPPEFLEKSTGGFFKGKDPSVPIQELRDNWVDRTIVLNIGKAGGRESSATLRSRLKQYMDFGAGKPIGHWGGRYIWQLAGSGKLTVCWMKTPKDEPLHVEGPLIQMFKALHGKRPFANLQG